MDSASPGIRKVRALGTLLMGVRVNDETVALVGQLTGAIYGLLRAVEAEHEPRVVVGTRKALSYRAELSRSRTALSRGELPARAWLAGFYFHSALARIASSADRLTKKLRGGRNLKERAPLRRELFVQTPEVDLIYRAVNDLKHDFEGRSAKDGVGSAEALKALRAEIVLARKHWPRRRRQ